MKAKRSHKHDKLARVYDNEILPIYSRRFGRLLLRGLVVPPKAMVLDVGCGSGYPSLELIKRMDDQGRIIAIDPCSPLLDVARAKAGPLSGKRIFFRSESAHPGLPFTDDVYDLVIANMTLADIVDPRGAVRDFARVAKPGGCVAVSLPLAGTFGEFHDIFRESLLRLERMDAIVRLDGWLSCRPTAEVVTGWLTRAGLEEIEVTEERFQILFRSSREFFYSAIIEHGPLSDWKTIAGRGQPMQEVFRAAKEAIDAYYQGRPFAVSVVAGGFRARKPERAATGVGDEAAGEAPAERVKKEITGTDEIQIGTAEIEVISDEEAEELVSDDREELL